MRSIWQHKPKSGEEPFQHHSLNPTLKSTISARRRKAKQRIAAEKEMGNNKIALDEWKTQLTDVRAPRRAMHRRFPLRQRSSGAAA